MLEETSVDSGDSIRALLESRESLHLDLLPYLEDHPKLGKILRHPLVFSVPYHEIFNARLNQQYQYKLDALEERASKFQWSSYISLHERPYRLDAFLTIQGELSDRDYWSLLGSIWADSENIWQNAWVWQQLLHSTRSGQEFLMDDGEREKLAKLPDQVRVYRGHQGKNKLGYSWTLSYPVAHWFAHRLGSKSPRVSTGLVAKSSIKALLVGRSEVEIVVYPDDIKDIRPVKFPSRDPELEEIFTRAWKQAPLNSGQRTDHGIHHWNKVDSNVVTLAALVPGCNLKVARLFACFHDSCRESESHDPEHGFRGALLARESLAGMGLLTPAELDSLTYACAHHEQGETTDDPTIGVCWDADRLDLIRVGIIPDAKFLSTVAARELICRI